MPSAISLVGPSNSGKTELICRLVEYWRNRDLRVAVVKHSHKQPFLDQPGKDTWRFHQCGAQAVALVTPKVGQIIQTWEDEPPLLTILESMPSNLDLILVEGYKGGPLPKLVLVPPEGSLSEVQAYPNIIGIISDQSLSTSLPVWRRNQIGEIAAFIQAIVGGQDQG